MTQDQYFLEKNIIDENHKSALKLLCNAYINENKKFKKHDVIEGNGIIIEILSFHYQLEYGTPVIIYKGTWLTKKLNARKKNECMYVYERNVTKVHRISDF